MSLKLTPLVSVLFLALSGNLFMHASVLQHPSPSQASSPTNSVQARVATKSENSTGSAEKGKALFTGRVPLQHGGPACVSCHQVAGLPFPSGGTLGPDLTHTYSKLGPQGLDAALQTLFFPAMTPLYEAHQLMPQERGDLKAFFKAEDGQQPQDNKITVVFIGIGLAGLILWLILAAVIGRNRLRGVRRSLLESVRH